MKNRLPEEEQEMLDSFEKGEWVPVKDLLKRKKGANPIRAKNFEKG